MWVLFAIFIICLISFLIAYSIDKKFKKIDKTVGDNFDLNCLFGVHDFNITLKSLISYVSGVTEKDLEKGKWNKTLKKWFNINKNIYHKLLLIYYINAQVSNIDTSVVSNEVKIQVAKNNAFYDECKKILVSMLENDVNPTSAYQILESIHQKMLSNSQSIYSLKVANDNELIKEWIEKYKQIEESINKI